MQKISLILYCTFLSFTLKAQFSDSLKLQLLKDWNRSKEYTLEYLNAMPAGKYDFRPHDSIRNFAQQMIHISQGTISLMEAATAKKIPPIINRQDLEQTKTTWTKDSVTYFVTLSYDYAIQALKDFDMNRSFEQVIRGKFNETRLAWALKSYEHQAHHRGQTAIYLRLAGIRPPFEKLFQ